MLANIDGDPNQAHSRWGQSILRESGKDNQQDQTRKKERIEARLNCKKEGMKGESENQNTHSILTHLSSSIHMCKALSKRKQAVMS